MKKLKNYGFLFLIIVHLVLTVVSIILNNNENTLLCSIVGIIALNEIRNALKPIRRRWIINNIKQMYARRGKLEEYKDICTVIYVAAALASVVTLIFF